MIQSRHQQQWLGRIGGCIQSRLLICPPRLPFSLPSPLAPCTGVPHGRRIHRLLAGRGGREPSVRHVPGRGGGHPQLAAREAEEDPVAEGSRGDCEGLFLAPLPPPPPLLLLVPPPWLLLVPTSHWLNFFHPLGSCAPGGVHQHLAQDQGAGAPRRPHHHLHLLKRGADGAHRLRPGVAQGLWSRRAGGGSECVVARWPVPRLALFVQAVRFACARVCGGRSRRCWQPPR